jgi:hypothetical protein
LYYYLKKYSASSLRNFIFLTSHKNKLFTKYI